MAESLPLKRLREWIAYRWVPKCDKCHRPLDRTGLCWYHNP